MDSLESYTIPFEDLSVICKIGSAGSAAVIHKALWKTRDNLPVAIKIYTKNPSQKEVDILRKLDHTNIIKFYGIIITSLSSGIVIEYASGGDLFTFLESKREVAGSVRLPRRQFTVWCLDVAIAIQYLHKRFITHKDIKSLNVLISDDSIHEEGEESLNSLKICDFGISKETTNTESVISSFGGFSKPWAAPEVIRDHRVVSQKSDIYSLCIVFWELWTCQQPWSEQLDYDIDKRMKQGSSLKIPEDFPEVMKPMMTKCWQIDRSRRCAIDDVLAYIKRQMCEWNIKDCRLEPLGNPKENNESGIASGERVGAAQQQTIQHKVNDLIKLTAIQEEKSAKQSLDDGSVENRQSVQINRDGHKEAEDFTDADVPVPFDLQETCNQDIEVDKCTHAVGLSYVAATVDDVFNVYEILPCDHNVPVDDSKADDPMVSPSDKDIQRQLDGEESINQAETEKDAAFVVNSNDTDIFEDGHVAYIINRFESLDALDEDVTIKRQITGIEISASEKGGSEHKKDQCSNIEVSHDENVYAEPLYKNLISPVPKIADYYDDVECNWLQPDGKSGAELSKLYKHVEESYKDLELVKDEFIDKGRLNGILNDGERRHLMINTVDVESIMSRFYSWFEKCKWQIPAVCELVTNILEADYLQPMINFAIYSHLQMNMLKLIRHRCLDFTEKLQRRGLEDVNHRLSFTDLQAILLKQANWLKKFHSILKSLHGALVVEMVEDESIIQDLKESCSKLETVIRNCTEHETRIIRDMEDHSTSLLFKLRFDVANKREYQKSLVSRESWVKKSGTVYVIDNKKQDKRQSKAIIEKKKYTMIAFVSAIIIVEDKGDYFKVLDCIHKKNIRFQRQDYLNVGCLGGEALLLTKLNPFTRSTIKEYELMFEDSNEIQEWSKVLGYSEEEKLSQDTEYITPLEILDTTYAESAYEDCYRPIYARTRSIYENVEAIQVLSSIITLNQKTTDSLLKLKELYMDNVVLSSIICEGEKHHLYLNVLEVNEVIESFNHRLKTNQYDSFHLFTELRKHLDEDAFHPIIEYEANMGFQRNMLQFQRKHRTAFCQVLGNLERDAHAKWRVSEMDLQLRLSKPADWLARLFHKLKTLEGVITRDPDHQESFHRLNAETLHMLHELIQREQDLRKSVERESSNHVTTVLLNLPMSTDVEPFLIQKLSKIQDDWVTKQGDLTLFTTRKSDRGNALKSVKKRYHSNQAKLYAFTSVIILTKTSHCSRGLVGQIDGFCKCYDRNYVDMEIIDTKARQPWMPSEREGLFKLWTYEKEDGDSFKPTEYVFGLNSDRSIKELMEWKAALVVATGESGKFDDYTRPSHIVSESFTKHREEELNLEVNDFVEILKMEYAMGKAWVKGRRLTDGETGWFPRDILGHEIDSEYNRGQAVKQRFWKRREEHKEEEKRKDLGYL